MLARSISIWSLALILAGVAGPALAWDPPVDCLGSLGPSGDDCGDVTYEGCCDGTGRLLYCDGGVLFCIDCAMQNPFCGWQADAGFYNCATDGTPEPTGTFPKECGPACDPPCQPGFSCQEGLCVECTPDCTGKACGSDGCGGSCGTCAPGELCAAGQCQANNKGCEPSNTPGCGGCSCEACVCAMDPFCCQTAWDDLCVDECETQCGGCGGSPTCGNGMCDANLGENCSTCPQDCTCAPGQQCQNGICTGGGGDAGCQESGTPGCGGCQCEACVCAMDPYCCQTAWDSICVDECQNQCGGCGGGNPTCGNGMCDANMGEDCNSCPPDCGCLPGQMCQNGVCMGGGGNDGCEVSDTPWCGGCACEACVCEMDPYCCEVAWDSLCVDECEIQCGGCGSGEFCGDAVCQAANAENCETCPLDCQCTAGQLCIAGACCAPDCQGVECGDDGCGGTCGVCDFGICAQGECMTGLGCAVTDDPGCSDCQCEMCVCKIDAYCCQTAWDEACVELCVNQCSGCQALPDCGDGLCDALAQENCGTCPQDCGCDQFQACINGFCATDYCALGVTARGCCMDDVHVVCLGEEVVISDCEDQGGICGWFPGNQQLEPGYYCGPEGVVSPLGDPDGQYDLECPACPATCQGKECGGNGCGGSCGQCAPGDECQQGVCVSCEPDCLGKNCGPDGCGGVCGDCPLPDSCQEGLCVACQPSCQGKNCGSDGCGASCGECGDNQLCQDGFCKCKPDCEGIECGPDGCNGTCGVCPQGLWCNQGICSDCVPDCTGAECGDNGCGGSCGECPADFSCTGSVCVPDCTSDCAGKECGPDGCDGFCGECPADFYCFEGVCVVDCTPDCGGKECGDDGCSGQCGECGKSEECSQNQCVPACVPDCSGAVCGDDGCGTACGQCEAGYECAEGQCQVASDSDVQEQDTTGGIVVDTPTSGDSGCTAGPRPEAGSFWLVLALSLLLGLALRRTGLSA